VIITQNLTVKKGEFKNMKTSQRMEKMETLLGIKKTQQ
jgi:hypothetical protein